MKLILDTNIILKALIRNSVVRAILLSPRHTLYLPEHAIDEIREHLDAVKQKTGLSAEEIQAILDTVLASVEVVHSKDILEVWEEAAKIMKPIDVEDVPFIAAALNISCDGIWSDDKHLKHQTRVKVWTTKELLALG